MLERTLPSARELAEITTRTDTRDYLAHATKQARAYDDYEVIVDIDAHVSESRFWAEICGYIENDMLKQMAEGMLQGAKSGNALLNSASGISFQAVSGRIPHQQSNLEEVDPGAGHGFAQNMRRSMDAMGIDYQVVFPSGMLLLGMHPMHDVEFHVSNAFNRWIIERIIPDEPRLLCLLYLPFHSPELCVQLVEKYAHIPGRSASPSAACVTTRSIIRPT